MITNPPFTTHHQSILKPVSPLVALIENTSLDDLALLAIAINRQARGTDTPPAEPPIHTAGHQTLAE